MSEVDEYRENLQILQATWDNLTLLGQLSGTGIDMSGTRHAFQQLTESLLNNLGQETLKKTVLEMKSKAQVAVDIMIRNLFERTADIGFLATDNDVQDYLERHSKPVSPTEMGDEQEGSDELRAMTLGLKERFAEYVRKYSVYSNVILLDTNGKVVLQLDDSNPVERSTDGLIRESLSTINAYVETFRHSDLQPSAPASLIYSYRVTSRQNNKALGVLCLCFRFGNETESIFSNLASKSDWSVIMLLDKDGYVIASGEEHHVPVGARMEPVLDSDWRLVRFSGREYIAVTRPTKGYQGYMGPGWYGHVMTPVQHAFEKNSLGKEALANSEALSVVMGNSNLFSNDLRNIPLQAERIQRELNRSVWNGNVLQSGDKRAPNPAFSKILLWEISNTGLKTKAMFERSIDDLHQTVVSSVLQDSCFLASLAIDIMDRNLYERANDCRWWALTSEFRRRLDRTNAGSEDYSAISGILSHINSLYTVYENLVVFDRQGKIVAVSNPDYQEFVGTTSGEAWIGESSSLSNSEEYTVSPFSPSPLYKNRHTYIYGAAIRSLSQPSRAIGSIGVVFDSEPQFKAMLNDALPRDGHGKVLPGCFGVFAGRDRKVVSSTRDDLPPGTVLELDESLFALEHGQVVSAIVEYQGIYYAAGSRMSKGYREYKGPTDRYRNDIAALIFVELGAVSAQTSKRRNVTGPRAQLQAFQLQEGEKVEIATFHVGDQWLGMPSSMVVEAVDAVGITGVPAAAPSVRGILIFRGEPITLVSLKELMQIQSETGPASENHVVVIHDEQQNYLGLLVDNLGEIPEVPIGQLEKMPPHIKGKNGMTESFVKFTAKDNSIDLLTVLSVERIRSRIAELQA